VHTDGRRNPLSAAASLQALEAVVGTTQLLFDRSRVTDDLVDVTVTGDHLALIFVL
jgi:hypothetical protein